MDGEEALKQRHDLRVEADKDPIVLSFHTLDDDLGRSCRRHTQQALHDFKAAANSVRSLIRWNAGVPRDRCGDTARMDDGDANRRSRQFMTQGVREPSDGEFAGRVGCLFGRCDQPVEA